MSGLILFLERKSIKKSFKFETKTVAIPRFSPGNESTFLTGASYRAACGQASGEKEKF